MRIHALVVAVALVAGSAATVSAAPQAPQPQARTAAHSPLGFQPDDFRSAAALKAARTRLFAAQVAQRFATADSARQPVYGWGDSDSALPDVDGDGVGDVLSTRAFASRPNITVLSGRTGRTLWSAPLEMREAVFVPAPAGKSVVLSFSDTEYGVGGAPGTDVGLDWFTVHAVNPKTGALVWSMPLIGTVARNPAGTSVVGVGEFAGVLLRKNATPYLLFDRVSTASSVPEVVDATTGGVVASSPPLGGDSSSYLMPVGDLDGDGTGDYVGYAGGHVSTLSARSGATGQPLWTTTSTSMGYPISVAPSPDLSGDGTADVLLVSREGSGATVHALSGATGADVWSTPGDSAVPLGDIDHDGRSDTRVFIEGRPLTLQAISGTGRRLWSRVITEPSGTRGVLWEAGDLDRDHYPDAYVEFAPTDWSWPTSAAIVNGRTGGTQRVPDLGWPTESLRGGAPSFVRGIPDDNGCPLIAYDGHSRRAFWHTYVKGRDVGQVMTLDALDLGHSRVGLIVLFTGNVTDTVALFDGRRGATLWKTTYALHQ